MKPIRVIIIDDSAFMRKVITDILSSDPRIEVVSTARNGEDGLKKIEMFNPDVVTMDIHMPVMDGIDALQEIMLKNPLPVVMLSSVSEEGASSTIEAISKGAVDFIMKPSGPISLNLTSIKEEIIRTVITAWQVNFNKSKQLRKFNTVTTRKTAKKIFDNTIIAIGTSTGGPRALQQVLTDLPGDFIPPILIVQHMPQGFTKSLANRLNTLTKIEVKEAVDGEIIKNNTAYIAPGNFHMKVVRVGQIIKIKLSKEALRNGHRPAVDELFDSVATLTSTNKIAVVLTGMGNDGSEGIKRLNEMDPQTIVLSEAKETAIVFGMPKAAADTKLVDHVVPLHHVGEMLVKLERNLK
ncbi:chemotaxis response regulator protein-glutamate methylesterase [Oceanobacillus chungangensis]|uniref:Protein-glutamate methylesterase/protein-glutamine glutaminase n=2 Tax=Oceanobacillus chungangensis TaxID=1229152 RepID=A0A3D8PSS1_9BACI|nr:chemotaxis response regulator protein-glutamate methylesterase [Oceanobacillus chungangensis]RDW18035.1 chemotaxis response regulator protein-glutamate methylesterase [Oceanobacillus chungangensis]